MYFKIENPDEICVIQKGFVGIAKKAKFDIIPCGVCNFDGYAKKLFEKNMTVKIGKPISYKLDEDDITEQWMAQICELTNCKDKRTEAVEV